jgi:hypothetical protein
MDDGSTPATTIPLARLESRTVTGRVTVPSGFGSRLEFSVGPFPVVGPSVVDDSYSMVLPTGLERARNTVLLTAEIGDGPDFANSMAVFPIDDSVTTLDLSVVAPAELSLPEEGVADVDYDTQFSWDPPANSMSILALDLDGWYVRIVTDDSSATIPDLSMWVMHRPGTRTEWWVENDIGTSVDEWVNDGMFDVTVPKTTSFSRTFTLAK